MLQVDLDHIVAHTEGLWAELRNQRIFITGGTGFIGTALLQSFAFANDYLGLNAQAHVLTRNKALAAIKNPHLASHPSIEYLEGDILSFDFPSDSYSHVIHAAAETGHDIYIKTPLLAFDVIVTGTRRILEFARLSQAGKILIVSSGSIYGTQPSGHDYLEETFNGAPDLQGIFAPYAEGKRAAEMLASLYASRYDMHVKVARCFSLVGPHMPLDQHFAIGNFIRDALNGSPVLVKGDGQAFRSYLYTADLVIWLWTILFHGTTNRPYNVGSDAAIQILDLAKHISMIAYDTLRVIVEKKPDHTSPAARYVPDIRRACKELGLSVNIPLREAICRTIHYYQSLHKGNKNV